MAGGVRQPQVPPQTGHVLPRAPWDMDADLRATQMARADAARTPR